MEDIFTHAVKNATTWASGTREGPWEECITKVSTS